MGFFSDIVDDVLDATEKVIKAPVRVICAVDNHNWKWDINQYKCSMCGATKKGGE